MAFLQLRMLGISSLNVTSQIGVEDVAITVTGGVRQQIPQRNRCLQDHAVVACRLHRTLPAPQHILDHRQHIAHRLLEANLAFFNELHGKAPTKSFTNFSFAS